METLVLIPMTGADGDFFFLPTQSFMQDVLAAGDIRSLEGTPTLLRAAGYADRIQRPALVDSIDH